MIHRQQTEKPQGLESFLGFDRFLDFDFGRRVQFIRFFGFFGRFDIGLVGRFDIGLVRSHIGLVRSHIGLVMMVKDGLIRSPRDAIVGFEIAIKQRT